MKRVLAIMGSPRKGEGYKLVQIFEKELKAKENVEFEYIFLRDKHLEPCKGCLVCLAKGEELCPSKNDDRDFIFNKMLEADGVIFSTPNYSLQVSSYMKNLFDRLAFIFHRPCFFGKTSIGIVNQGVFGGGKVVKYLNEVAHSWGFNITKGVVVSTPPGIRLPEEQRKIEDKIRKAARGFYEGLNRKDLSRPGIMDLIIFRMVRTFKPYSEDIMPRDYEYFKEKGWMESDYYYETKLGIIKRAIGKMMDRQAAKMGEKMIREQEEYEKKSKNITLIVKFK